MPAQALMHNLSRQEVEAKIAELKAGGLLTVTTPPEGIVVVCKADAEGTGTAAGAANLLQQLCNADAAKRPKTT